MNKELSKRMALWSGILFAAVILWALFAPILIDEQAFLAWLGGADGFGMRLYLALIVFLFFSAFALLVPFLIGGFVKRVQKVIRFGGSKSSLADEVLKPERPQQAYKLGYVLFFLFEAMTIIFTFATGFGWIFND